VVANQNTLVGSSTTIVSIGSRVSLGSRSSRPPFKTFTSSFAFVPNRCASMIPGEFRKSEVLALAVEHADIDVVTFLGGRAPTPRSNRTAASAVDGVSILCHPLSDGVQPFDEFRLNFARGHGSKEEEVGVRTRPHEPSAGRVRDAEVLVVLVVAPGPVERLAGLQWQLADGGLIEARGIGSRQTFLEHLKVFAVERSVMMIAANQRGALQQTLLFIG
jgi:hypothetical protein